MQVNKLKRRRTDDDRPGPTIPRKLSIRSKGPRDDDQYRKQMYIMSVRDALRKKSEVCVSSSVLGSLDEVDLHPRLTG